MVIDRPASIAVTKPVNADVNRSADGHRIWRAAPRADVRSGGDRPRAGRKVPFDAGLISRLASGKQRPSQRIAARLDEVLDAGGSLAALPSPVPVPAQAGQAGFDDEIAALELSRRASATDVGEATVERLELAVDGLAVAYHRTPLVRPLTSQ